jgi:hypothetical protein
MVRATIYIPDAQLWRDFRSACIQRDKSASEMIAAYVATQIEEWQESTTSQRESEPVHA